MLPRFSIYQRSLTMIRGDKVDLDSVVRRDAMVNGLLENPKRTCIVRVVPAVTRSPEVAFSPFGRRMCREVSVAAMREARGWRGGVGDAGELAEEYLSSQCLQQPIPAATRELVRGRGVPDA